MPLYENILSFSKIFKDSFKGLIVPLIQRLTFNQARIPKIHLGNVQNSMLTFSCTQYSTSGLYQKLTLLLTLMGPDLENSSGYFCPGAQCLQREVLSLQEVLLTWKQIGCSLLDFSLKHNQLWTWSMSPLGDLKC